MAGTDRAAGPATGAAASWPIERLQLDDAEGLCPLSIEAGWNQVAADWRLMLTLGQGFGVRGANGEWIASALALPLGPTIAWLSMVLVTKLERGQGLGTRLLSRCIAEVEDSGAAAGLDATELGRPIYLPLGFRDVYPLSRWHAGPGTRRAVAPPDGIVIRVATPDDLPRIVEFDSPRSGFERAAILANLLSRAPAPARVAERADGTLTGYALGRDGHRALHVGPVVAEDEAIALSLLSRALAGTDTPVIADIPDQHGGIRRWLADQGAFAPRSYVRMLLGDSSLRIDDGARVFALAGPELA
jgi:GNAT superfamily N-acetyltransferase